MYKIVILFLRKFYKNIDFYIYFYDGQQFRMKKRELSYMGIKEEKDGIRVLRI